MARTLRAGAGGLLVRRLTCGTSAAPAPSGTVATMTKDVERAAHLGHCVVALDAQVGPLRLPGATVLLLAVSGEATAEVGGVPHRLGPARAVVADAGRTWRLAPLPGGATVLVVAAPGGPEQLVRDLAAGRWTDPVARLTAALEAGAELLL